MHPCPIATPRRIPRAGRARGARALLTALAVVAASVAVPTPAQDPHPGDTERAAVAFVAVVAVPDPEQAAAALRFLDESWRPSHVPMALESVRLMRDPRRAVALLKLIAARTGQSFGYDLHAWYEWLWSRPPDPHPFYEEFKQTLYGLIDERFEAYFEPGRASTIRLDEVVWGGVRQDGIPPLRAPAMIGAAQAGYLADGDVVFGVELDGDARAYPKRILAWHEMFVDEVGGVPVAGVYCTLCGTVIVYRTEHAGVNHALGTSGFLYRSNKLMYDRATSSLWNTFWGRPVHGPLVGKGIELERFAVVTTTWREWRRRHPDTRVLSLDTGHERDYAEGAAYREYFATDELMFAVPERDARLLNKDEVLGIVLPAHPDEPVAFHAAFLAANPVHHDRVGDVPIVVLTDPSGANRVYEAGGSRFARYDGDVTVTDADGVEWRLAEDALTAPDGRTLARLPAQRAFWFGWYGAWTHTRLVR